MLPIEECAFNQLMTKNVPHILEIILFSLDYKSFANCRKVSNTWRALLTSKSFQKKANSIYIQERVRCEKKLLKCSDAAKVYYLLSIGVDPNCQDSWGLTPLYYASKNGKPEVIKLLLCAGAGPNISFTNKYPLYDMINKYPLYAAVEWATGKRHMFVVKLLLEAGADPNITGSYGNAPLHEASMKGNIEVAKLLLNSGADPNIRNTHHGHTPLHSILDYRLQCGRAAEVSFQTESKVMKMIEVLLKAGADPCIPDNAGITALDLFMKKGPIGIIELIVANSPALPRTTHWNHPRLPFLKRSMPFSNQRTLASLRWTWNRGQSHLWTSNTFWSGGKILQKHKKSRPTSH